MVKQLFCNNIGLQICFNLYFWGNEEKLEIVQELERILVREKVDMRFDDLKKYVWEDIPNMHTICISLMMMMMVIAALKRGYSYTLAGRNLVMWSLIFPPLSLKSMFYDDE